MTARALPISPLADVAPVPMRWLWRDRIPLEAISSFQGDGASGKSTLARWLTSRVSRGDLDGDLVDPANALWLNVEEHPGRDILPGLERQGADLARIFCPHHGLPIVRLPKHLDRVHDAVVQRSVRLVVLDQANAFFSTGREDSIREAMTGLREIAEECGCAVLLTRNLNGSRGADPYCRGRGGGLIVDVCRAAFHLGLHPDDGGAANGRRVLACIKGNLPGQSLLAIAIDLDANGRVVLGEELDLRADALLARPPATRGRQPDQLGLAIAFLLEFLDGREVPTVELEAEAGERGLSQRTLDRARVQLGILHRRVSVRNTDGSVTQRTVVRLPAFPLPEEPPPDPAPRPPTDTTAPRSGASTLDDAVIRFSLLELDPIGRADGVDKFTPAPREVATPPTLPTLPTPAGSAVP